MDSDAASPVVHVHEVTVSLAEEGGGPSPPAWAGLTPPERTRPLDALHHMLQEAAVLSSHLRRQQGAVQQYAHAADRWFEALRDWFASSGDPALYENALTPDGVTAARAAAGAVATAQAHRHLPPEASAAAGVQMADDASTPFGPEAAVQRLPLLGAAGVTQSGVSLCPAVPGTAALGVRGGLSKVVPAELHLPTQHAALFSTEAQRALLARGASGLQEVLRGQLLTTLQLWLDTYEECKSMLPQVEHLRVAAERARSKLDAAQAAVVAAEASHPLVTPAALTAAGVAVPRVLVRGSEGTTLLAAQGDTSAAGGVAAGGATAAELVAVPAAEQRQAMYQCEQAETDATLSFELAEKVLRDRLRWLITAGAGFKALVTAGLAHSLRTAADGMGQTGQAAGGTAAGAQRAPEEELLVPFPQHVLARLQGAHLPTLPDLVLADQERLAHWCDRYRAAMAAEAAATAAAAGAQMMAAAAGAGAGGEAGGGGGDSASANVVTPLTTGPHGELARTDVAAAVGAGGGDTAAAGRQAVAAAPAGPQEEELQRAAARTGLPLDLLAAAVSARVQEQEAAAAKASKGDLAWRLLHDASVSVGKEQAVLLPEVTKAVGGLIPTLLTNSHTALSEALTQLSKADPATPAFDLAVLEVAELLEHHHKVLRTEVLPALSESDSKAALRSLASAYRRRGTAATTPTRPHTWLLSSTSQAGAGGGGWVSAAVGAASSLAKAPVRAGVALADAAADAAHFGVGGVPLKAA